MDFDEVICNCLNITKGDIKNAVDGGATTFEEVQEATEVGSVCGACIDEVTALIDELVSAK